MTTRILLNVDFYRNLLVDDPGRFLDVVEGNKFPQALTDEIHHLLDEMERRRDAADRKHWILLNAKMIIAMGEGHLITDEMRRKFPSSEDPIAEELSSMSLNPLDPIQREGKREPFKAPNLLNKSIPLESQKLINICYLMKVHKRLIDLIEKTPIFNAGWNLINPNQPSSYTPILGLHGTPAADNNSNCSHFH